MKNRTATNKLASIDPVLEVEKWKDKTDQKVKNMTLRGLKRYYEEALRLVV